MSEDQNYEKRRTEIESELRAKAEELAAAFSDFAQDLSRDLSKKADDFSRIFAGMAQDFRERAAAEEEEESSRNEPVEHPDETSANDPADWRSDIEARLAALEAAVEDLRSDGAAS
jgi:uncharacterized protein YceH (UPF0502 family)